ncbi:MAG TPA: ABC transporter permease, partial [Polyangiaceae bacterium]|nr:ABC transporter permease [Polyangiaceae bacterium]
MALPFEWFVALRYLREERAQTALILAAVSVGVSVVVFLSALISGLQTSLIDKTLGSQPHVTVRVPEERSRPLVEPSEGRVIARAIQKAPQRLRSIDQWPAVAHDLERVPGVIAVSPSVTGAGFAERGLAKRPVVVRGVDPDRFGAIIDVRKRLRAGRFEVAGSTVVLGSALAADLGVSVGEKVRVVTSEGVDDTVTVGGIFELGNKGV